MEVSAEPPVFGSLRGRTNKFLPRSSSVFLGQAAGTSMWPALRTGDLVFGHPFRPSETTAPGTVLVVEGPDGLMAHRLMRCRGRPGKRRFLLAGDLSGPDFPVREHQIRGVAEVIYRKGIGFVEIAPPPGFGPIGRRLVSRFARLWEWLERHRTALPSDSSIRLLS